MNKSPIIFPTPFFSRTLQLYLDILNKGPFLTSISDHHVHLIFAILLDYLNKKYVSQETGSNLSGFQVHSVILASLSTIFWIGQELMPIAFFHPSPLCLKWGCLGNPVITAEELRRKNEGSFGLRVSPYNREMAHYRSAYPGCKGQHPSLLVAAISTCSRQIYNGRKLSQCHRAIILGVGQREALIAFLSHKKSPWNRLAPKIFNSTFIEKRGF